MSREISRAHEKENVDSNFYETINSKHIYIYIFPQSFAKFRTERWKESWRGRRLEEGNEEGRLKRRGEANEERNTKENCVAPVSLRVASRLWPRVFQRVPGAASIPGLNERPSHSLTRLTDA